VRAIHVPMTAFSRETIAGDTPPREK